MSGFNPDKLKKQIPSALFWTYQLKVASFQKVRFIFQISKSPKKIIPKNYPELEILISSLEQFFGIFLFEIWRSKNHIELSEKKPPPLTTDKFGSACYNPQQQNQCWSLQNLNPWSKTPLVCTLKTLFREDFKNAAFSSKY